MKYITTTVCCEIEADGTQGLGCQANSDGIEAGGTQPLKYPKNINMFKNYLRTTCIYQIIR